MINLSMMLKFAAFVILAFVSVDAFSQAEAPKKITARPDIPGTFVLEFGVNRDLSAPPDFSLGLFGSRSANLYYQYEFRILKSHFSFVPGIGLSLERFKFKNNYLIDYATDASADGILMFAPADTIPGVKKSQLITNYIEVPLELRYSTNPEDPARSFKISIGGRIGYMYDSFSKVKYKENGEAKKIKNKEDFNLTKFRYGVTARIGVGNLSIFGYYNLSSLFEDGKGVNERVGEGTSQTLVKKDFSTMTIGISLASF
jgi:hypothetical protein